MSVYIKRIYEGYQYKNMKALTVYPVKKKDAITVGAKLDRETVDELILQLLMARQVGAEEISIKAFNDESKKFFITIEKLGE